MRAHSQPLLLAEIVESFVVTKKSVDCRVSLFASIKFLMLSAEGRDEIDVRSLTAGLYLIKVSGRNGSSIVRKMLVTR